ncbi:MAG: hypothetical protein QOF63_2293 [Thermoanaerobaculia bacterium]|nr:hypothetical protein [Thermoanaerobaculia bacterium]
MFNVERPPVCHRLGFHSTFNIEHSTLPLPHVERDRTSERRPKNRPTTPCRSASHSRLSIAQKKVQDSAPWKVRCGQRSSSSRSNRSLARTGSCARRRTAAMIAAMQRRVGSIRPIRIRKRCCRLYPDSRARWAGLIPRLFRYCSSRVGMCNIVHSMPMKDRCQCTEAYEGS